MCYAIAFFCCGLIIVSIICRNKGIKCLYSRD